MLEQCMHSAVDSIYHELKNISQQRKNINHALVLFPSIPDILFLVTKVGGIGE